MSDELSPEENDMREDYAISLLDLTFNSKPIINMLTTIAQENLHAARPIVRAIEDRIASAPPNQRLPCIYLLDSICKNVGSPFTSLFSRDLYKTFMACYTNVVDNNVTRNKLKDLFKTWKLPVTGSHSSAPVFSTDTTDKIEEALYKYEGTLSRLRGGPVYGMPAPYPAPHQQPYSGMPLYERPLPTRPTAREYLLCDMEDLLRMLESCIKIDAYKYQPYFGRIQEFRNLYDRLRNFEVSPSELDYMREELRGIDILCKQLSSPVASGGSTAMTTSELLDQLAKTGLINSGPTVASQPVVELNSVAMLTTRLNLVGILYDSMPLQCLQCGQRWQDTEADRAQKDEHLDRHFKTNRRLQEHSVRSQSRALYMTEIEWIDFTIADSEVKKPAQPGATASVVEAEQSVPKPSDPALSDYRCPSCQENFESFWDDPTEEWKWRNAINVNGVILHPLCYADLLAKQSRSDAMPVADHETVAVKQEIEEGQPFPKKEESDEEDDDDIALPTFDRAPPVSNSSVAEQTPANKDESADGEAAAFVLPDALKASLGTLSAANGFKRKASEDGEDDTRRIKLEL